MQNNEKVDNNVENNEDFPMKRVIPKVVYAFSLMPVGYYFFKNLNTEKPKTGFAQLISGVCFGAGLRYVWEELKYSAGVESKPLLFDDRTLLSFGAFNLISFGLNPLVGVYAATASFGCESTRAYFYYINTYFSKPK